jgi:hypothetical protein
MTKKPDKINVGLEGRATTGELTRQGATYGYARSKHNQYHPPHCQGELSVEKMTAGHRREL